MKNHATDPRITREMRNKTAVLDRVERQASKASKRVRLTDQQRADRAMSGTELQAQIVDLATILGWYWCHWRAMKNQRGFWEVPVSGPLGKGWPDLFMVHPARRRVLAVEVKRELGDSLTPHQEWVHGLLRQAGLEVVVWRPSDMSEGRIQVVLQ